MHARGHLRAKRLYSALPYVWFADYEVAAKKKRQKSQSTEAVEAGGTA